MRLMRLAKQLAVLRHVGWAHTAAAQHLLPATASRYYQAAVDHASDDPSSATKEQSWTGRPQQQLWAPQRSLPAPSHYGVKVTIKAHDLKFVKMASTVIRDLMLVNFAPKSRDVVSAEGRKASKLQHVQLAMPIGDAALPIKRTHYTVIRGPHVHKTSREQFARTTHQRVLTYATNNQSELNWFLDSLKLYKFVGVELVVRVTSNSYLLPTSSSQQAAAEQPLLLQHKQRFAHLFGAAAPSGSSGQQQQQAAGDSSSSSSSSSSYAALQQSLQGLRSNLHQGLLQQRLRLARNPHFDRWSNSMDKPYGPNAVSAAAAVGGGAMGVAAPSASAAAAAAAPGRVVQDAMSQQLQGSSMLAADQQQQQQQGSEQAFLAAVDKALLQLKLDVLDRHKFFPYLMAFYKPGQQQMPAAEWMHAMLKYGKVRQQQVEASQQQAALQTYQQLGQVQQALLLQLLQKWHQAADASSRRELGMLDLDAERVDNMLYSVKQDHSNQDSS